LRRLKPGGSSMAIQADFDALWVNLPQYFEVRKIITNIPEGWETCCIQMSHAFNQAGLTIDYDNKSRILRFHGGEYLLDVKEMRDYIDATYEDAEVIPRTDVRGHMLDRWLIQTVLADRQGIIAFGNRHIDLWNGRKIHGERYIERALWEAASAVRLGLFFWEVSA
jgi:hypothetical protein